MSKALCRVHGAIRDHHHIDSVRVSGRFPGLPRATTQTRVEVPGYGVKGRARLEVTFEPGRTPDGWTTQLLEVGAHIAALLLEVERAQARSVFRVKPAGDGCRSAHWLEPGDQSAA